MVGGVGTIGRVEIDHMAVIFSVNMSVSFLQLLLHILLTENSRFILNNYLELPLRLAFADIFLDVTLCITEKRVLECLLPTDSFLLADSQTLADKIFRNIRNQLRKTYLLVLNGIDQLQLIGGHPWSLPMQHLVKYKTHRPQIRFVIVFLLHQQLRRHVQRRPHYRFQNRLLVLYRFGKTKVTYFALSTLDQDIGWFQIPVDDILVVEVLDPLHNLLQVADSLPLAHLPLHLQIVAEIMVAHLRDNVHIVAGLIDVMQFDNVFMTDLLHNIDLGMQIFKVEGIGEDPLVDHLHSNRLTRGDGFAFVN